MDLNAIEAATAAAAVANSTRNSVDYYVNPDEQPTETTVNPRQLVNHRFTTSMSSPSLATVFGVNQNTMNSSLHRQQMQQQLLQQQQQPQQGYQPHNQSQPLVQLPTQNTQPRSQLWTMHTQFPLNQPPPPALESNAKSHAKSLSASQFDFNFNYNFFWPNDNTDFINDVSGGAMTSTSNSGSNDGSNDGTNAATGGENDFSEMQGVEHFDQGIDPISVISKLGNSGNLTSSSSSSLKSSTMRPNNMNIRPTKARSHSYSNGMHSGRGGTRRNSIQSTSHNLASFSGVSSSTALSSSLSSASASASAAAAASSSSSSSSSVASANTNQSIGSRLLEEQELQYRALQSQGINPFQASLLTFAAGQFENINESEETIESGSLTKSSQQKKKRRKSSAATTGVGVSTKENKPQRLHQETSRKELAGTRNSSSSSSLITNSPSISPTSSAQFDPTTSDRKTVILTKKELSGVPRGNFNVGKKGVDNGGGDNIGDVDEGNNNNGSNDNSNNEAGGAGAVGAVIVQNNQGNFPCTNCEKQFKRSEHLKRHIRSVHSNIRPYECKYCDKKFSRLDNLAQHLKTHVKTDANGEVTIVFGNVSHHTKKDKDKDKDKDKLDKEKEKERGKRKFKKQ